MNTVRVLKAVGLILSMVVLQGAVCGDPDAVEWQQVSRSVDIDPATGDTIITVWWRIGTETRATFKRYPKGNSDRRHDPLPPIGQPD